MNEKTLTERQAVERERKAFAEGLQEFAALTFTQAKRGDVLTVCGETTEQFAALRYPLPKVTRPRVVTWHACDYRMVDGELWVRGHLYTTVWVRTGSFDVGAGSASNPDFFRMLADLLANPTETVDADD